MHDETAHSMTIDVPPKPLPVRRALTARQERRLVNYLEERFLQCTRNFRKRSEASSTLRTLPDYIDEARHLLGLILQIPPIDPSTSLRTSLLLRLTGDVLSSIPGYSLTKPVSNPLEPSRPPAVVNTQEIFFTLQLLIDFLDDLDNTWLAVLEGQAWDPETAEGVPIQTLHHITDPDGVEYLEDQVHQPRITLPSQTDKTRLRSLLLGGVSALEEWLLNEKVAKIGPAKSDDQDDEGDLTAMLDKMGLLDDFDGLFVLTLNHLGGFGDDIAQVSSIKGEVPMT